jgi:uncharacterized protein YicC (UPF0701 family)
MLNRPGRSGTVWQLLQQSLQQALAALDQMRRLEGDRLAADLLRRGDAWRNLRLTLPAVHRWSSHDYRQRLMTEFRNCSVSDG